MDPAIQFANNIIPFPDPSVIIPFPVALAAGDGFCLSAEAQPGSGNASGEGSASSNEATGDNILPLPTNPSPSTAGSADAKPAKDDEDSIDILKLGLRPTRREELLLPPAELTTVQGLRRALQTRDGQASLETLLERLRNTPDNATFLRRIQPTLPA